MDHGREAKKISKKKWIDQRKSLPYLVYCVCPFACFVSNFIKSSEGESESVSLAFLRAVFPKNASRALYIDYVLQVREKHEK